MAGWKFAGPIAAACLMLAACGQFGGNGSAAFGGSSTETEETIGRYTEAYNKLADDSGVYGAQRTYAELNVAGASPSSELFFTDVVLTQGLKAMRDARAASKGPADLDAAADKVIAALDTLTKRTAGLSSYFQSKAYRADNLARGKAEDAPMKAEFAAAADATEAFQKLLERERRSVDVRQLDALKASGDTPRYLAKRAISEAKEMVDAFPTEASLKDAKSYAVADAALPKLEATLKELGIAKADPKLSSGLVATYDSTIMRLNMAIAQYRSLRTSKSAEHFNGMVEQYNGAIEITNVLPSIR